MQTRLSGETSEVRRHPRTDEGSNWPGVSLTEGIIE